MTLSGENSYSGGTTLLSGTLVVNTASLPGNILNRGTLVFDQETDGTYAGVISNTGSLVKTGGGTLTLSGANTYTGTTTVAEGMLVVNGTMAGLMTIDPRRPCSAETAPSAG